MNAAQTIEVEQQEVVVMKPEAHLEKETMRQHWLICPGCIVCWPESVERESDI